MKNILRLFASEKKQIIPYLFALLLALGGQIARSLRPAILQFAVDGALQKSSESTSGLLRFFSPFISAMGAWHILLLAGGLLVAIAILQSACFFFRAILAGKASETIIKNLRTRLYNHIQLLPYKEYSALNTGDLIQRATGDVHTVRKTLSCRLIATVSSIFILLYTIVMIFHINSTVGIIAAVSIPLHTGFILIFFSRLRHKSEDLANAEAVLSTTVQENLTGIRVVKAFARQPYELKKFIQNSTDVFKKNLSVNNIHTVLWGISDGLFALEILLVTIYAASLVIQGSLTLGALIALISYISLIERPVSMLGRLITELAQASIAADRIYTILDKKTETLFPSGATPPFNKTIALNNVSFSYNETAPILNGISFSIESGTTLGIMGGTGSGKSTIAHILARLFEYDSGSVTVGGIELNTIDKGWVRSQVALVLQEPFLYARPILENIKLPNPKISTAEAHQAAQIASVEDDILEFESGYDTLVGERGVSLSGGQKQRLAIARALIKKSPVLIFDDSLSAVDTKTDRKIREALVEYGKNKTVIIISHRVSTLMHADKIVVLENGRIAQSGSPEHLLAEDGLYRNMYTLQLQE